MKNEDLNPSRKENFSENVCAGSRKGRELLIESKRTPSLRGSESENRDSSSFGDPDVNKIFHLRYPIEGNLKIAVCSVEKLMGMN